MHNTLANNGHDHNEVWLLLDSFTFGGIETHVLELAKGLVHDTIPLRVILLTRYSPPSAIIEKLQQWDIPYCYLSALTSTNKQNTTSLFQHVQQLRMAVAQHHPIAVHAHGYKASIISKLAVKTTQGRTRQLTTYHAGEIPKGKVRLYDMLDRYSALLSDVSLCVSPEIQSRLPSQSLHLNNFVSMNEAPRTLGTQLAFVGRLSHEKGPDRLCGLALQHLDHPFYVYGDGPMMATLTQERSDNVHLLGFQRDMHEVWNNIGLLIITSRYEGLPMTALEAMSRGIPVLTLNIGALNALIEHGKNGWIADDMQQLSLYLNEWLQCTDNERALLSHHARQTIQHHYSTKAVIPKIIPLYSQHLHNRMYRSSI
ncbi:glycosyltransferase family 4 protein [Vibrio rarus]|uniref:glycosyltransferase family 4 protein n=1 Tax=Vibrio rarus TaxID=413403 RepID=UPI0021C38760|nr:glycosyltransferase family 4 protein [Vibrio rarus]